MKHIIYLLVLSSFFNAFCQTERFSEGIVVKASFSGMHCNGQHGLCDIEFLADNKKTLGNGTLFYSNNTVKLILDRTKLSDKEESRFLSFSTLENPTYLLENDFEINNTIVSHLNLKVNAQIAKGNYPLEMTEETFIIEFKLR